MSETTRETARPGAPELEIKTDRVRGHLDAAAAEISALCKGRGTPGGRAWTMCVPVQDTDSDVVLGAAVEVARRLCDEVDALRALASPGPAARPGEAADDAMRAFDAILDEFRDHVSHGSNIIGDKLERALREMFAEQVAARQEADAAVERRHVAGAGGGAILDSCDWPEANWLAPHFRKELAECRTMRDLRATAENILGCVESLRARVRSDREMLRALAAPRAPAPDVGGFARLADSVEVASGDAPGDDDFTRGYNAGRRAAAKMIRDAARRAAGEGR